MTHIWFSIINLVPTLLILVLVALGSIESLSPGPDLSSHTVVLSVDDGYQSVYDNIFPLLKRYHMTMTLALIANSIGRGTSGYNANAAFLTKAEVQEMIDSCHIEIASHTLTHPWLTRLDSAEAWFEISHSKTVLESLFGTPVITFVYPYGDMNAKVRRMVKNAGYRLARAVRSGDLNLWVDPYRIPEFELRIETDLASVQHYIRNHRVTVLLLHRIVPQPRSFTEWRLADFEELLDWLHRNHVRTVTLADLEAEWRQERIAKMIQERPGLFRPIDPRRLFQEVDVDATHTSHPR